MATRALARVTTTAPSGDLVDIFTNAVALTQTGSDVTASLLRPAGTELTVQGTGTWGAGGAVMIEGSLDGTNWEQLKDPFNNLASLTNATRTTTVPGRILNVMEPTLWIRGRVTGGDGTTSLTLVFLFVRRR